MPELSIGQGIGLLVLLFFTEFVTRRVVRAMRETPIPAHVKAARKSQQPRTTWGIGLWF